VHTTHWARIQLANLPTLDTHHLMARMRLLIFSPRPPHHPVATSKLLRNNTPSLSNTTAGHYSQAMALKAWDIFLSRGTRLLEGSQLTWVA
jgi:hypothetical protein